MHLIGFDADDTLWHNETLYARVHERYSALLASLQRLIENCDFSFVRQREQLGIGMTGTPALTYTTNVIFRCPQFTALHDKGRAYRFIIIGEQGTWATIVAINGRDRWRFSIVGSDSKRTYTEAEVREAIVRAMGQAFDFEILSMMH